MGYQLTLRTKETGIWVKKNPGKKPEDPVPSLSLHLLALGSWALDRQGENRVMAPKDFMWWVRQRQQSAGKEGSRGGCGRPKVGTQLRLRSRLFPKRQMLTLSLEGWKKGEQNWEQVQEVCGLVNFLHHSCLHGSLH